MAGYFENMIEAAGEYADDLTYDAMELLIKAKEAYANSSNEFDYYSDECNMNDDLPAARAAWASCRYYDGTGDAYLAAYNMITQRDVREHTIEDELAWLEEIETVR